MKFYKIVFIIIYLSSLTTSALLVPNVSATVTRGNLHLIHFGDFATRVVHLAFYEDYLPSGGEEWVNVYFHSYEGTGEVTIKAMSNAFTNDSMTTIEITHERIDYAFNMTFKIETDIDGNFDVKFEAYNEFDVLLDDEITTITVWSPAHLFAANKLYSVETKLDDFTYQSSEGFGNLTLAQNEYNTGVLIYHRKDWVNTSTVCDSALSYIEKAYIAEIAWLQSAEENRNASTQANDAMINLFSSITTPMIIVGYLGIIILIIAIAFLVVILWRKILSIRNTT
jgi:hypothetical protein